MKISEDYDPSVIATLQGLGLVDHDVRVADYRPLPGQTNGLGVLGQLSPMHVLTASQRADIQKALAGSNVHPFDTDSTNYYTARDQYRTDLKVGSKGLGVRMAQRILTAIGFPADDDGIFGSGTAAAVKAFQKSAGVPVTGVLDDDTKMAIAPVITAETFDVYKLLAASKSLAKLGISLSRPPEADIAAANVSAAGGGTGGNTSASLVAMSAAQRKMLALEGRPNPSRFLLPSVLEPSSDGSSGGASGSSDNTKDEKPGDGLAKLLKSPWYWVAVGGVVLLIAYYFMSKRKALPGATAGMGELLERPKRKSRRKKK